jgi:hypothetical protein
MPTSGAGNDAQKGQVPTTRPDTSVECQQEICRMHIQTRSPKELKRGVLNLALEANTWGQHSWEKKTVFIQKSSQAGDDNQSPGQDQTYSRSM